MKSKMNLTYDEMLTECRKEARKNGLVFKRDKKRYVNNKASYKFIEEDSRLEVLTKITLNTAYENCMSGYISSYDKETKTFRGI